MIYLIIYLCRPVVWEFMCVCVCACVRIFIFSLTLMKTSLHKLIRLCCEISICAVCLLFDKLVNWALLWTPDIPNITLEEDHARNIWAKFG